MAQGGPSGAKFISTSPTLLTVCGSPSASQMTFQERMTTHLVTIKFIVSYLFFPYLIAPNGYQEIVPLPISYQEAIGVSLWGRDVI